MKNENNVDNEVYDVFGFLPVVNVKKKILTSTNIYSMQMDDEYAANADGDSNYFVYLFNKNRQNEVVEDIFEAKLLDPITYIKNMVDSNSNIFGVIVRKTEKSQFIFKKFIEDIIINDYCNVKEIL